jgi:homoserine O-acetyltransferase/O-succinyltransferase
MSASLERVEIEHPPPLSSGFRFQQLTIGYRHWGELNAEGDNAVLVCPALTGDSDLEAWWPALLGPDRALDPARDFIVCADVLGGSGQTTGPASAAPDGRTWDQRFPEVSVRDMVQVQRLLLDQLGVQRLKLVIGGSLGGMQALEWAVGHADDVEAAVTIAAPARQSPWARALNHVQRRALVHHNDLELARMIAMLSYRHWTNLDRRFDAGKDSPHPAEDWLDHHGRALKQRFDPISYRRLTEAMDSHDVGRRRGGWHKALSETTVPTQVIGISSDLLYPPHEQQQLARTLPLGRLDWLDAPHGHDAFLIAQQRINEQVIEFRQGLESPQAKLLETCP